MTPTEKALADRCAQLEGRCAQIEVAYLDLLDRVLNLEQEAGFRPAPKRRLSATPPKEAAA